MSRGAFNVAWASCPSARGASRSSLAWASRPSNLRGPAALIALIALIAPLERSGETPKPLGGARRSRNPLRLLSLLLLRRRRRGARFRAGVGMRVREVRREVLLV